MAGTDAQRTTGTTVWALAAQQHGVVARHQLLAFGLSAAAIEHRLRKGRLHRIMRGVYAVGRPELTQPGRWMAAVLRCGPTAALSYSSAGACLGILPEKDGPVEVSVAATTNFQEPGIHIHRRRSLGPEDISIVRGIRVTRPVVTLVDLASRLSPRQLEAAINEAHNLDLVDPDALRRQLKRMSRRPGLAPLRRLLDAHELALTDSELERRFLKLVRDAGCPSRSRASG